MARKSRLVVVAAVLTAVAAVWVFTRDRSTATTVSTPGQGERSSLEKLDPERQITGLAATPNESERDDTGAAATDILSYLRARYGDTIDSPYVQMQVLDKLVRHYQRIDPANWHARVLATLREAFPERAEELARRLEERLAYESWMEAERDRLRGLDPREREAAIWEARHRIFGTDVADAIWAGELEARAVADALQAIDGSVDTSIDDKLQMYRRALDDVHEGDASGYLEANAQQAMDRFFDVDSVQRDLAAMEPEERRESLREIRASMGLDDAALVRWDALDRERDERWARGERYMEERATLLEAYQGAELETQLAALRTRYFGARAEVIAREEASGFFRFDQPRRWGRN